MACHSASLSVRFWPAVLLWAFIFCSVPIWDGNRQLGLHVGAAPFAAIGFIKYHGMTAEKFLWVWIKSEILMPKYLVFHPENLYYELTKDEIRKQEKEAMGKHVKNTKNRHAAGQGEV